MSHKFTYIRSAFEEPHPDGAVVLDPGFTMAFSKEQVKVTSTTAGEDLYREFGDISYEPTGGRTHVTAREGIGADELEALMQYATKTRPEDRAKWPTHMRLPGLRGICVIRMVDAH